MTQQLAESTIDPPLSEVLARDDKFAESKLEQPGHHLSGEFQEEGERSPASTLLRQATRNEILGNAHYLRRQVGFESNARTYPRKLPIAVRRAEGIHVEDTDGRRYIDCLRGREPWRSGTTIRWWWRRCNARWPMACPGKPWI